MGFHEMPFTLLTFDFQLLITLLLVSLVARGEAATPAAPDLVKLGCSSTCGNVTIPFPFGIGLGCYLKDKNDSFLITCNNSKPFLRRSNIPVLDISLDGQVRINPRVSHSCFDESGVATKDRSERRLRLSRFRISSTRNKFTAVGCSTLAIYLSRRLNYTTGCVSLCESVKGTKNGSCSGIGCCQASIPEGVRDFRVSIDYLSRGDNSILKSLPCSYAFLAEETAFNFSSLDLKDLQGRQRVPVVLDWAVGYETCEVAKEKQSSYACKALKSDCVNSSNGPGYRCNCSSGYEGNPYLPGGCEDINECERSNPCFITAKCENKEGNFTCSCKDGYEGDGIQSCKKKSQGTTYLSIALGITMGFLALMVGSSLVYYLMAKRKLVKLRQKFFEQNGGFMLTEKLNKHDGSVQTARIFTAEDLKKATNNYHESRVIGQGGYGTVYKGVLSPNNREVAIKKSKVSDQSQIEQFINEVIVLSQINHRNVVKLIGCCLETEVPMLVYEFITNGTLSEHIHDNDIGSFSLSWEMRLKIAAETAGAIAYLHSATSTPIIHRDIKSSNILLDENYTAKVADFGASKLVPLDHTQLATLVQGTFGYMDPEYFHSNQLTEKSDVYSFGVLLAELLTGEKALSFDRPEKDRSLAMYFVSSVKIGHGMLDIVEKRLVEEGNIEQIKVVGMLAARCLRLKGEERPSMKEVAMELEGLKMTVEHPWVNKDSTTDQKETEYLLNQSIPSEGYGFVGDGSSSSGYSSTAGFDSMRDQMTKKVQFR